MTVHRITLTGPTGTAFDLTACYERGTQGFTFDVQVDGRVVLEGDLLPEGRVIGGAVVPQGTLLDRVFVGHTLGSVEAYLASIGLHLPADVKAALVDDHANDAAPYIRALPPTAA